MKTIGLLAAAVAVATLAFPAGAEARKIPWKRIQSMKRCKQGDKDRPGCKRFFVKKIPLTRKICQAVGGKIKCTTMVVGHKTVKKRNRKCTKKRARTLRCRKLCATGKKRGCRKKSRKNRKLNKLKARYQKRCGKRGKSRARKRCTGKGYREKVPVTRRSCQAVGGKIKCTTMVVGHKLGARKRKCTRKDKANSKARLKGCRKLRAALKAAAKENRKCRKKSQKNRCSWRWYSR